MKQFSLIEQAVEAIAAGKPVIVVDSEERENEGDFVAAADNICPSVIHFMLKQGRGQLCMPVPPETARRLDLQAMVPQADLNFPQFAIPVDHKNCETGISPVERASTIQAIADSESQAGDFIRPGHIFPLLAQDGGVLARPGHTEAAVDLSRLAGLSGCGVLCEICSRDGRKMARYSELVGLAREFGLAIVAIDQLMTFRTQQRLEASSSEALASNPLQS